MSLTDYETYVVVLGERGGRRYAERLPLHIPLPLATGNLEDLSALQLRDTLTDLEAEVLRRLEAAAERARVAAACGDYDPQSSQHLGGHE